MTTPSKTPITDAMLKKPGFSPSEWINASRRKAEALAKHFLPTTTENTKPQ